MRPHLVPPNGVERPKALNRVLVSFFFFPRYRITLSERRVGAVKKVPSKRQAVPEGAACKIFVEKGLVQWKNQPFGDIMNL